MGDAISRKNRLLNIRMVFDAAVDFTGMTFGHLL